MARPNAVAENNAIANTPASAVTVIGARARRSSVIPLPNTANPPTAAAPTPPTRSPRHRGSARANPAPVTTRHRPSDTGSNTGQLRSCARDCGHRFGERLTDIAASVSGGVTHALPLFPQDNVFPEDNVASSIAVTPVFWHLLRFSDSRQIPMRCQFALRKLSVVSAHKRCLRSLSANAKQG